MTFIFLSDSLPALQTMSDIQQAELTSLRDYQAAEQKQNKPEKKNQTQKNLRSSEAGANSMAHWRSVQSEFTHSLFPKTKLHTQAGVSITSVKKGEKKEKRKKWVDLWPARLIMRLFEFQWWKVLSTQKPWYTQWYCDIFSALSATVRYEAVRCYSTCAS